MAKALLIISQRVDDLAFAKSVAQTAGLVLLTADSVEAGVGLIAQEKASVIFLDASTEKQYKEFEAQLSDQVGLFSDKINANAIHFINADGLEAVEYLVKSPLFGHYLLRNYGDPTVAGAHYGRIVKATLIDRAFGLENLLKPGAKIQKIKLQTASQKQQAVDAVKGYLIAAKYQNRMATVIANAVDELLMNSIFDAPVDNLGKQLLVSTSRSTDFPLEGKSQVELHVGYDGDYAALTAIDSFGSLDKNKLLAHISKIYKEEEYRVRTSVAGAGIGLATVFKSGGSFFFVSEKSVKTEVTVFFKRMDTYREFRDQFRFLSTQFYF